MSEGHSTKVVLTSLAANAAIAVTKTVAAVFTHSGSMLAEAIHTAADCVNQVLLLVGIRQSSAGPSERYPLGTGRASYFWSFVVALMLFTGGGAFSIGEGVEKVLHPEALHHVSVGLIVLGVSFVLEALSLRQCVSEVNRKRGEMGFMDYLHVTKDAELVVCTGENFAAVVGLAIAFLSMALAMYVDPRFDGAGSVLVGLVLVWVAWFLARKMRSLLLGERADPEVDAAVQAAAADDPRIQSVLRMISVQQGPGEVMLAVKLRLDEALTSSEVITVINEFERRVRGRVPDVKWQFVEPDTEA
ncbi:MAG: cation diffusion facilitator family transporter [Polyangiales bacterium]